jgi:hypothetical protein
MTHRHTAPGPSRSIGPKPLLALLAAALLMLGGCAQMGFPELPAALKPKPAAEQTAATPEADADEAAEDGAVAETVEPMPAPEPGKLFEWSGDGRDVTRVVIDTNAQLATFYAGGERVGWTTIATGVASHPTPRGEFSILEKVRDKRSNLYGKLVNRNGKVIRSSAHGRDPVPAGARFVGASMPHFMRLTYDGIGMHAGPIPNPGQPASHGCIRMPPRMAETVFAHVGPATAVTVVGNGPDYGNYAARIARQRAEEQARRAAAAAAAEGTALDALDAEIEALEEAGVEVPDSAADAAAPGSSADRPARDGGGGTQASASAAPAPAAADTGAEPSGPGTSEAPSAGAPQAGGARSDDGGAGAAATPTRQPDAGEPEQRARPDVEPLPAPEAPPAAPEDSVPEYYGPPAAPPTIRSADSAGAAPRV